MINRRPKKNVECSTLFINPHDLGDQVRRAHEPLPEGALVWNFGSFQLADGDIVVYEIPEGEQPAQLEAVNVTEQQVGVQTIPVVCPPLGSYVLGYFQLEGHYFCYTAGKYFSETEVQELAEKKRIEFLNAFFDSLFLNPE